VYKAPISAKLLAITILALILASCAPRTAETPQATQAVEVPRANEARSQERLVIAIQPSLAASDILERAKPLEQYLEQKLGNEVDIEIYVPLSQAGVIEALRFGHAHVAFMGAWPAQLAVEMAGADLVLAEVREVLVDGKKTEATYYFSYWVTLKDSPYQSLTDLRGKRACFPSPISTSGYVFPMGRMVELGLLSKPAQGEVVPKTFFAEARFGGGYSQCWEALKTGQVDVSIIAGDVPEQLYNDVLANTRVLEQQGPIPSHGVLISKELKEPLRSRMIEAIAGLGDPQYRNLMRGFISGIFVGFQSSNAESHLYALKNYLAQSGLLYSERIGRQ
jgi:phosphonate transport system substrate-binding protein